MKKNVLKRNINALLAVFILLFAGLIAYLGFVVAVYGERWFVTPYNPRIQNMQTAIEAGDIYDRQGRALLYTTDDGREYISNDERRQAVAHIIGDSHGMTYGAQTFYAKYLFGFDKNAVTRISDLISGQERHGSDITLTIDAKLSAAAKSALGEYDGAAVVMNYQTGEILASVSAPGFDPEDMEEFLEGGGESELVNRAFTGLYPPGSTFKMITASALIAHGLDDFETHCAGSTMIGGEEIACWDAHGETDLERAITKSCNVYFAEAAALLPPRELQTQAEKFLFNKELLFDDVIMSKSVYETAGNDVDAAWAAIGQYHDLVTPLHMCMIAASIANGGEMMTPKLLKSVDDGETQTFAMSPEIAATPADDTSLLQQMMRSCVTDGTGKAAAVDGVTVCGKTGTAEVAGEEENAAHAWFVGYIADDDHPIAIAIVMERAGSGGGVAAPAAHDILKKAVDLGY